MQYKGLEITVFEQEPGMARQDRCSERQTFEER
jgi:hypothetical protein